MNIPSTNDVYIIAVPIILVMIFAEASFSAWHKKNFYQGPDTLGSLGLLAGNILAAALIKATALGLSLYLYQFRFFTINELFQPWMVWLITLVMIDLVFYWYHRCSHRVRVLWAVHMNHHCSEEMNFVVAFRQAWFGPVSKIPFFVVLPLIGFDPTVTAVAGVMATLWGVVGHTKWIGKMGPLEWIMNTPSHHRVHHGSNPQYIDKNYGNLLIIWDRMFGTFEPEIEAVVYGLVNDIKTNNPFKITFHIWIQMFRDLRTAKSAKEVVALVFGPPEWQSDHQSDATALAAASEA